uniref:Uncharacterized protein n=1 Tax=Cryptomonas curvata TaxID=233186 RepID=A0A6T7X4P8_9CRYP|nr:hypothetical protein Cry52Nrm1_p045 [Cryptomonas curvata]|mmetsp:Transcript_26667/g.55346  ORF Transcript_26667/g.55346 Transcript_26667/m.55346 type:complete len:101 (+) Transcript_26667:387-689(+)
MDIGYSSKIKFKDTLNKEKILIIKTRKTDPLKPYQFINKSKKKMKKSINYGRTLCLSVYFKYNKFNSGLAKNNDSKQIKNIFFKNNNMSNNFILNSKHFN